MNDLEMVDGAKDVASEALAIHELPPQLQRRGLSLDSLCQAAQAAEHLHAAVDDVVRLSTCASLILKQRVEQQHVNDSSGAMLCVMGKQSEVVAALLTCGCCGGVVLRSNRTEGTPYLPSSAANVCPVGPPPHIATG